MTLPKINIKYNRLLDPIFIFYCQNNPDLVKGGWNKWTPPSKEELDRRVKFYKEEWVKFEEKILKALAEATGLDWNTGLINVHIVSGNPRQISNPLIIKSGYSPSEFVGVLTHELIHRLFMLNEPGMQIYDIGEKYAHETEGIRRHTIVHALLKYVYLDILSDESRLVRNIESCKKHSTNEYSRAWEIVVEVGYKDIISELQRKIKDPTHK